MIFLICPLPCNGRGKGPILPSKAKQDGKGEGNEANSPHLPVAIATRPLLLPRSAEKTKVHKIRRAVWTSIISVTSSKRSIR